MKIGYVEDNKAMIEILETDLPKYGIEVYSVTKPKDIKTLPKELDGLITDGDLGGDLTFEDSVHEWHKQGYTQPIIVYTSDMNMIKEAKKQGMAGLDKGMPMFSLAQIIENYFRK